MDLCRDLLSMKQPNDWGRALFKLSEFLIQFTFLARYLTYSYAEVPLGEDL